MKDVKGAKDPKNSKRGVARGKKRPPVMAYVVASWKGMPVSVDAYPSESAALKAYKEAKDIHGKVASQQAGHPVGMQEKVEEKSRVRTSRSGLPSTAFDDGYLVTVVRDCYSRRLLPGRLSFVASLSNGRLSVTCFEDRADADEAFGKLKAAWEDRYGPLDSYEGDGGYEDFLCDDTLAAVGPTPLVGQGGGYVLE